MTQARDKANIPVLNFASKGIDDNSNALAMTIDSAENVGIGATSMSVNQRLLVQGANTNLIMTEVKNTTGPVGLQLTANNGTDAKITFGDTADNGRGRITYSNTDESMRFDANNLSEKMRIISSGNVGIGLSVPEEKLHVNGTVKSLGVTVKSSSTEANLRLQNSTTGGGTSNGLLIQATGNDVYINNYENADMYFRTNNTDRIKIENNGNVGIGESSPLGKLHVKSADSGASVNGGHNQVIAENSGNSGMSILSGNTSNGAICFGDNGNNCIGYVNYTHNGNHLDFGANGSEKMRIGSNGHIGMNTTTLTYALNIANTSGNMRIKATDGSNVANASTSLLEFHGTNNRAGFIGFVGGDMRIDTDTHSAGNIQLGTNGSERMRIDSSGNVLVGKTSSIVANVGHEFNSASYASHTRSGDVALYINRTTNDGTLIEFRQNNSNEGTISVSGSTVSYNGFTGTHWSRFTDNSTPTILRGTVLETLDEMCDWYNLEFDIVTQDEDGNDVTTTEKVPHVLLDTESDGDVITYDHEGTDIQATIVKEADVKHMMSKVSDTTDAKNVYGLFVAYDLDGEGYNDFYVASVGSYVVRIKQGETIAKGDLLQSNGDGTAKVQTDDNIKSSSFAKILSTTIIETYEDGSYLVPCSLNC